MGRWEWLSKRNSGWIDGWKYGWVKEELEWTDDG